MTVVFVPGNAPHYTCLSSDLIGSGGSFVASGSMMRYKGAPIYLTDTQTWKVINDDNSVSNFVQNVSSNFERTSPALIHRSSISAVDKVSDIGTISLSGSIVSGGSLVSGTGYYTSAIITNPYGCTKYATIVSGSPSGSNNAIKMAFTIPAGAVSTDKVDFFLSVDAAPKHVASCTVAQFQTGGIITAENGAVAAGGAANSMCIGAVGTGQQSNAANFAQNTAYLPASVSPIVCTGKVRIYAYVDLALTDLRTAPALSIIPFMTNSGSAALLYQGQLEVINVMNASGQSKAQVLSMDVDGTSGIRFLIDNIAGQGASCTIYYDLV